MKYLMIKLFNRRWGIRWVVDYNTHDTKCWGCSNGILYLGNVDIFFGSPVVE